MSVFQSYKTANLSNWTWTNSFGYTLWKGIGVGFELGLRNNKQEALNNAKITDANSDFSSAFSNFNFEAVYFQFYMLFS